MQLEQELGSIEPATFIPYWDWTADAKLPDPASAPIWAETFMGGNGLATDQWRVQSGPFAHKAGNWSVPSLPDDGLPGPGLKRQFGRILPSLPTEEDLKLVELPRFRGRLGTWVSARPFESSFSHQRSLLVHCSSFRGSSQKNDALRSRRSDDLEVSRLWVPSNEWVIAAHARALLSATRRS
jgi:hypothetical protein